MGTTLGFDTKQRNSFLIIFGVFFNKNKILTILFMVKYEKITLCESVFKIKLFLLFFFLGDFESRHLKNCTLSISHI
jgi:hypothetical protein